MSMVVTERRQMCKLVRSAVPCLDVGREGRLQEEAIQHRPITQEAGLWSFGGYRQGREAKRGC